MKLYLCVICQSETKSSMTFIWSRISLIVGQIQIWRLLICLDKRNSRLLLNRLIYKDWQYALLNSDIYASRPSNIKRNKRRKTTTGNPRHSVTSNPILQNTCVLIDFAPPNLYYFRLRRRPTLTCLWNSSKE